MCLEIKPKDINRLFPTEILFQTEYWAKVKTRLGWTPYACDIVSNFNAGDILLLVKSIVEDITTVYVPQGPEIPPEEDNYGSYLEKLSESIVSHIGNNVAFIRYDLPWLSPYADIIEEHNEWAFPDDRIWEMRMNFGTKQWNLRKAPFDTTPRDNYIVDISGDEQDILARMRSKTRYNIRLAMKKGVNVRAVSSKELPRFYELYLETAFRNRFFASEYKYFCALFDSRHDDGNATEIVMLMASHGQDVLSGAIITLAKNKAFFLHGASSNLKRNYMGSYLLHWEAIRYAQSRGCHTYDMGAVSPTRFPAHPFFGLYRFKSGFGGRMIHQVGTWDYLINDKAYRSFRNGETLRSEYENRLNTASSRFS